MFRLQVNVSGVEYETKDVDLTIQKAPSEGLMEIIIEEDYDENIKMKVNKDELNEIINKLTIARSLANWD